MDSRYVKIFRLLGGTPQCIVAMYIITRFMYTDTSEKFISCVSVSLLWRLVRVKFSLQYIEINDKF
jgi:hypothetical protein